MIRAFNDYTDYDKDLHMQKKNQAELVPDAVWSHH